MSATTTSTSLKEALAHACTDIEATIDALLPMVPGDESVLLEAMRYASLGGGKRLRGFLAVEVASLFGADRQAALRVAASVEMLHAYSLVHDDLPSMDDDDLRRGQPSTHRQFDEAIAILAGDALQTRAFEILVEPETSPDATIRANLALALARASGAAGMVGGQVVDIRGEGRALPLNDVRRLHALKTGALIRYAAESGAILAGVNDERRDAIVAYGRDLGTAFQVADDVLDTTASAEELGKTAGKDEASGKSTYVSLLGIDGARAEARRLSDQAREALSSFGAQAAALRALADYVVERRN
ncbi:farnesyl-diphosphate synthase [Gluconobacter japonicus]|uniref:Polyprenyl synthetase family protein n=1 Tax=Gluconobacter japonicus TaxID=376620 RepID=A0A9Q2IU72_GLUJA|nr:farnesyl diphosphate synthase [Gluconobacter japonicus]KXV41566.1 farnesyl-diphosphate synthase [Gluconobacter japonicus]MBF0871304.1 polyprenyl synthetase family protein [Gluconobacter japonicus]GAD09663.1 geranylgeranyl pyrophosphate synthase [Gluconobacter frateurii NBRC 103465]GAP23429.1 geranylgeranyl pyrophosphate synthase [Gluconobacter frateurii NBRC 101659]